MQKKEAVSNIAENLNRIKAEIPANVKLVAVSKTKGLPEIMKAYQAGQRIFGENKVQELIAKQPELPADIQWHFIGHLQTNKVKYITPFISMIESVDRMKILQEINKQAMQIDRIIPCLLQFHIAEEETKFGLDMKEAEELLTDRSFKSFQNISICGVMGMATFTQDFTQVKREFAHLRAIFQHLKEKWFTDVPDFCEISMGMSGDYQIAIEEGSTMIRVGSKIFGQRY
ncbi:MAG TPA: YggS family pyridoxal phosphate-dependent enzyme [Bacteroidales bacterium]|nr:YggS family pyridoxal phosphate-dependent enzyme [Bacteroidales bacterium]